MNDIIIIKNWLFNPDECIRKINSNIIWQRPSEKSKRFMCYLSDTGKPYEYAGVTLKGDTWSECEILHGIKKLIEDELQIQLNSVLLNLYPNGKSEIRWHSDKEPQLGDNPVIPCVNLGATRKFHFMNKETKEKTFYEVASGDLLVMGPNCQKNYLHAILEEKGVTEPRISLTYRYVYDNIPKTSDSTV